MQEIFLEQLVIELLLLLLALRQLIAVRRLILRLLPVLEFLLLFVQQRPQLLPVPQLAGWPQLIQRLVDRQHHQK